MHEWKDRKQDRKKQNNSKNMKETKLALKLILDWTVRRLLEGKAYIIWTVNFKESYFLSLSLEKLLLLDEPWFQDPGGRRCGWNRLE